MFLITLFTISLCSSVYNTNDLFFINTNTCDHQRVRYVVLFLIVVIFVWSSLIHSTNVFKKNFNHVWMSTVDVWFWIFRHDDIHSEWKNFLSNHKRTGEFWFCDHRSFKYTVFSVISRTVVVNHSSDSITVHGFNVSNVIWLITNGFTDVNNIEMLSSPNFTWHDQSSIDSMIHNFHWCFHLVTTTMSPTLICFFIVQMYKYIKNRHNDGH